MQRTWDGDVTRLNGACGVRPEWDAEQRRVAAVRATGLLDTEREPEFDQVVEIASAICGTPISAFTLVDEARLCFKAAIGLPVREMDRKGTFCEVAIRCNELFEIHDAALDEQFSETGARHGVRFYAGMPLSGPDGSTIGTLCVADVVPRTLTEVQRKAMVVLGTQLRTQMELRAERRRLKEALEAREQVMLSLRSSEERFRMFMHHGPFLSFIKDAEGRFVFYNKRASEEFGVQMHTWIGRRITDLWPGELSEEYQRNDQEAMRSEGSVVREEETRDSSGHPRFWRSWRFGFTNERSQRMLGVISLEITEEVCRRNALERSRVRLERLATEDSLTGLLNRRVIEERLGEELFLGETTGSPVSVVMVDVDHFKQINDRYGHETGDAVLRLCGTLLHQAIRIGDAAGRYGGEEMLLVLPRTDERQAMTLVERLRRSMREADWPAGCVTASFGVASTDESFLSAENLVARADAAMYAAKRSGRDRAMSHGEVLRMCAESCDIVGEQSGRTSVPAGHENHD